MNVIIMGCGRVGSRLAAMLDADGHKTTILDVNEHSFRRLPQSFHGTALVGNGTEPESLKRAGIEGADAFIAVTEGDNRNVMAAQIAKHMFNVGKVICRIYDPLRKDIYEDIGLEVISPTIVFAQIIKDKLMTK